MFLIIFLLQFPASHRLINRHTHRIRYGISIHDNVSLCISRCTSYGLYQRSLRTQKSFFICIQNCHQGDFRNIQSFPQKIDSNQDIKHIQTHIPDNLCPFQCINIRMQILHPYSQFFHIICQIFCHPFCQCGNQYFMPFFHFFVYFSYQIINLSLYRTYLYEWIQKSCWTNNLLCS